MRQEKIRTWLARHVKQRLPSRPSRPDRLKLSQETKGLLFFYGILLLFPVSSAGTLTGLAFFVIAALSTELLFIAASAFLLAFSASLLLWAYLWATG